MKEIGEILHVAGSGRVIIQASESLPEGQILCDRGGTRIAKVMEMIGPVSSPFASAVPLTNSIKKYVGKAVFAGLQEMQHKKSSSKNPKQHNRQWRRQSRSQQRINGQPPKNAQKNRRKTT